MKKSFVPWIVLALFAFVLMGGGCGGGGGESGNDVSIDGTWKIVKSTGIWNSDTVNGISAAQDNTKSFNISINKTETADFEKIKNHESYNRSDFYTVTLSGDGVKTSYGGLADPWDNWGIKDVVHELKTSVNGTTTLIIGLPTFKRISGRRYQSWTNTQNNTSDHLMLSGNGESGAFFQEFYLKDNDELEYNCKYSDSTDSITITLRRQP